MLVVKMETLQDDALNPVYQMAFHFPLTGAWPSSNNVTMQLLNHGTTVLGELVVPYQELLDAKDGIVRDTRKIGEASLAFAASLSGVVVDEHKGGGGTSGSTGATGTAATAVAASETVRITIEKGYGFVSPKKRLLKKVDVPDVYCIVQFGSSPSPWRTETIKDSETPFWNESREYPLTSGNQIIRISVWDANRRTKDHYLGCARTSVGKVLLNGGRLDVEVVEDSKKGSNHPTGIFITVQCQTGGSAVVVK
jgi:hypothetical protein